MRKYGLYLVAELSRRRSHIDCDVLRQAFCDLVKEAHMSPLALEEMLISVVEGADTASVSLPLTHLMDLGDYSLFTSHKTVEACIAPLLKSVSQRISQEINADDRDYRPLVMLLLAGTPPDEREAIHELQLLKALPSEPLILIVTTSEHSFGDAICQCLCDAPVKVDQITGDKIMKCWHYYRPNGLYFENLEYDEPYSNE